MISLDITEESTTGDFYFCFIDLYLLLLKSLIIHQVKTKKITTVKKVWRFYFSLYSSVFASIEKIYQTLDTLFHQISKHLEFRQNILRCASYFQLSLLGVWISWWNTVSRVWYLTLNLDGDAMARWFSRWTLDRVVWVGAQAEVTVLCCVLWKTTSLSQCPPFTQVYKWTSIPTRE